jgi:hypothetical protein
MNFYKFFFYFCGSFLPSRIRIRIPNPGPDPLARLNPDPIRIRIRNPAINELNLPVNANTSWLNNVDGFFQP